MKDGKNSATGPKKENSTKLNLLKLVDADTQAFNQIMNAFGLPKSTDEEKAIPEAKPSRMPPAYAIEIPFKVMQRLPITVWK
jgi:glutamate formiminotransferase/formiminotetrahydrofolate cyclodeaminase